MTNFADQGGCYPQGLMAEVDNSLQDLQNSSYPTKAQFNNCLDCKTVVFGRFRKARSAVSMILECEARKPHTPAGRARRENDCRLFIQQIRSKRGLYNVTEVTEIA